MALIWHSCGVGQDLLGEEEEEEEQHAMASLQRDSVAGIQRALLDMLLLSR
jgi:hypothetical protein